MKKKVLLTLLALAAILATALGASQARTLAPGLRVAVVVSGGGPNYYAGAFQRAGLELAKANLAGEINLSYSTFEFTDSDNYNRNTLSRIRSFEPDFIIGPVESEKMIRLLKLVTKTPIIAVSAIQENIGSGNLYRLQSTQSQDLYALASYLDKEDIGQVDLVFSSDNYSKTSSKYLAFALSLRGVRVKQFPMNEYKGSVTSTCVLVTAEQSLQFLDAWGKTSQNQKLFLVPSNLANYSSYDWADTLEGAKGLLPFDEVSQSFRQQLSKLMGRPELLSQPASTVFGIAKRTFDAVMIAVNDIRSQQKVGFAEDAVFDDAGYFQKQKYSLMRYSKHGIYSPVALFDPKNP